MLLLCTITVFMPLLYFSLRTSLQFWTSLYHIPAPKGLPIVGNLVNAIFLHPGNPEVLFELIRKFSKECYPIYRISLLSFYHIVAILDPNDVQMVLSSTQHLSKTNVYTMLQKWLGTGLLTSTGAKWHQRRKILTPTFHANILEYFVGIFNKETDRFLVELNRRCGQNIDILPLITDFTLASIETTAMGLRKNVDQKQHADYKKAVYMMGELLTTRLTKPWLFFEYIYSFTKHAKEEDGALAILRDYTMNLIAEKKREKQGQVTEKPETSRKHLAMLDLLLESDIDDDGIREEVDTFIFEGHDTTAMALSFLVLIMANYPHIQEQMRTEIIETIGLKDAPNLLQLNSLKYVERCIKETLRLFPSVPFITRRAGEDFTTKTGYKIPKNTILHIHIFDIHRNPELYPNPLQFDPDRFLPQVKRHSFSYIGFSAGPRNCIGQKFAMLELKSALCGILRSFTFKSLESDFRIEDIKYKPDLVLRPRDGVNVIIERI